MDKIFEPGELEFAASDPNEMIAVQQDVKELLGANRQRQEGIKRKIRERGAWALPGIINATYIWSGKELSSKKRKQMLAALMAELAADNPAAQDLIFRAGILETPFAVPRAIARMALDELGWQPTHPQSQRLVKETTYYQKMGDANAVLDFYSLLLTVASDEIYRSALTQCREWAEKKIKQSGELMKLLLEVFPKRSEDILTKVILAAGEYYKDTAIADTLANPLRPIPTEWLADGVLINVSTEVLRALRPPRHTTVEYLWCHAVKDFQEHDRDLWESQLPALGAKVREAPTERESIYRYWFRAVGEAKEYAYVIEQARADDPQWGTFAILQLIFDRSSQVKQAKHDLQVEYEDRYQQAKEIFDDLTGGEGKKPGTVRDHKGPTPLARATR